MNEWQNEMRRGIQAVGLVHPTGHKRQYHGWIQRALLLYGLPPYSPNGDCLPLEDGFLKMKTISEAYGGKVLPFHVAMLVGSSVTCRETGKSFVLEDINQVYLAPLLRK